MIFTDMPRLITRLEDLPDAVELRGLPQFYRADLDLVWRMGGPTLRRFLDSLGFLSRWRYLSIDTRTHMLQEGMYPCIPGWHCDDFYRPRAGEPDLYRVMQDAPSEHAAMVIGSVAPTVFLDQVVDLDPCLTGEGTVYGRMHKQIEAMPPKVREVHSGEVWWFSSLTWHRGSVARRSGSWRFFARVTGSNHRQPKNEIRTQTQVYLESAGAGW